MKACSHVPDLALLWIASHEIQLVIIQHLAFASPSVSVLLHSLFFCFSVRTLTICRITHLKV